MNKSFDFSQVPDNWAICHLADCARCDECMRYQAFMAAPKNITQHQCVLPAALSKKSCPHFHPIEIVRAAKGFRHIFDEIKAKHQAEVRHRLIAYLGSESSYYRYRNGSRMLMPEQQEWIRKLLEHYGYTETLEFDAYEDVYRFEE